jgi:hypothetical protein
MSELLHAIETNLVSVLDMPPSSPFGFSTNVTDAEWIMEQVSLQVMDSAQLAHFALESSQTRQTEQAIKQHLARQLQEAQCRPPFITKYRRYVIIGDESEKDIYGGLTQWVCLCHLSIGLPG